MATTGTANGLHHRHSSQSLQSNEISSQDETPADSQEHLRQLRKHVEKVKAEVLEQVQGQLGDLLEKVLTHSIQTFTQRELPSASDGKPTNNHNNSRSHKMEDGKVFVARHSILDELFEISHIRTIYHVFIAAMFLFIFSTLAVDYIDQGRLVLEFDLLCYAFGKLPTVLWSWLLMFSYTLAVPYQALVLWGVRFHGCPSKLALSLGAALTLAALQGAVLGVFPIYVVIHYQLPPASRFIVILEQIRFLMKSYSFIRENVPLVLRNPPNEGEVIRFPTFSSYLYFLFCPTLIYRESYPRNPYIRWNYVGVTFAKILACLFYGYFILVRLCIPVFRTENNQPFSTRTLVLMVFNATLPGMMILLLAFYAFLHCWLNAFAEMLRFADRMFYKDWWNSTSFANYYRTWNVVVHDWLYYYSYRDFLWLSTRKFRTAAMLSVFLVSAVVHEYAFTMCFGFFYPVMFCLFAVFGVLFHFTLTDKRKSPVWNIMMWTCLFIGQGVQVCLYGQEFHAQVHCPRTGGGFWELVTPRSWNCSF